MKLSEHVDRLRNLIEAAFDKQFARLGIGKSKQLDIEKLPEEVWPKRKRYESILQNHIGETGDYEHAREKLIDELTFTLFNRLAAVKVMEAAALFPPVLTKQPEHGDRSFGHKAWLERNEHMRSEELEGIREYIIHEFDLLGETLPLYNRSYPYALLPDPISLNEIIDAFNAVEKDSQVGSDIWQSDDVLGWLYESYNNRKKQAHKDSKDKTEYNKVSLQSQVYTPRWVVQFLVENSLGKLYLEMYPDSEIKRRYKIANAPQTQERKPKPLHEVKAIDPACGSGNFLLYAFDFFYELYVDQIDNYGADYNENEIPGLIIENNLHGIDLDDRAVQLAQLGLYIKARKKRRTIGELHFKVVSSDFFLPDYDEVKHIFEDGNSLEINQKKLIADVWEDLKFAYKFGSLIRLDEKLYSRLHAATRKRECEQGKLFTNKELGLDPEVVQTNVFTEHDIAQEKTVAEKFFKNLKIAVEQYAQVHRQAQDGAQGSTFLTSKTRDAITFLELLTTEYDVATANPPYTDSADFGPELKEFIEDNYKKPYKFHTNLYATFIKRCYDFTGKAGFIAMVHPPTFMYIKTFEDVRKFMIDKTHINFFVEWGYLGMFNPSARVDSALYILEKSNDQEKDAVFVKLNHLYETKRYDALFEAYEKFLAGSTHELLYRIPQSKLKIIKSWPFIYWISDEFREKFKKNSVKDLLKNCQGMSTTNNLKYLRFWWEIRPNFLEKYEEESKWFLHAKGGPYCKWHGNMWVVVNYENYGQEMKEEVKRRYPYLKGNTDYVVKNESFYFKEGITYSASGSKGTSFRYLQPNATFNVGGSSIFPAKYSNPIFYLAYFNSKLCSYIIDCLNPTVNTNPGDLDRLPFVVPSSIIEMAVEKRVKTILSIKTNLSSSFISELEYNKSPYNPQSTFKGFFNYENHLLAQVLINEAIINENIFEIYDLTERDRAMVLAKEGVSIGGLPVTSEARDAYLAETEATKEFPLDTIREFIEALPVKEFTAEEREAIESGFGSLYQSNNDLEEFCIRNKVNPINVWYWFKQSNVIPQQRMHTLAMEFLADMIREILMEDEDGIIPLVPNAGEKVLLDRIEEKFREKGFSSAQYSSFDSVLGRPIHEYLNKYFFAELSDHLNLFMYLPKTPFIWHLSSGPEQGFDCYIIIYKWSRDKLMRLRSVYIEHRERSLVNRQSDLSGNQSADAQNEKDRIFRQLKEIEAFKTRIDELLAEGYNPILDDGVGKNIAPLQKKKMIPYEVLNEGQLKKYLNADW
ncbi:MAG: BREX-1 system adenine-specific DNA-methyltransferase PglX [Fibrobacter sp.]|mgnify:CR=1 FL=1|nr:BREX-1 system adenine-specific DNA-methyltransferase PglX [Fibrobacter sp.]